MGKPVGRAVAGGHRGPALPTLWPCLPGKELRPPPGSPGLQSPERMHHHSTARAPPQTSIRVAQWDCYIMGLSWGGCLCLSMQCKIFVKINSKSLAPWGCTASLASCFWSFRGVLRPWGPCLRLPPPASPCPVRLSTEPCPQSPKLPSRLTLCLAIPSFGESTPGGGLCARRWGGSSQPLAHRAERSPPRTEGVPCDVRDGAQHLLSFSRPCSRGQHSLSETAPWRFPCQGHS